jgi:hypothetical protein
MSVGTKEQGEGHRNPTAVLLLCWGMPAVGGIPGYTVSLAATAEKDVAPVWLRVFSGQPAGGGDWSAVIMMKILTMREGKGSLALGWQSTILCV